MKNKIAYGLGGFGKNLAYMLVSSYSLYYFNSVLGVSATFVGFLLMAARIFDAFNDPVMGAVVEKTNSRFGPYKPWIMSGAVLNALVLVAMFSVPETLSGGGAKVYISIMYFLCGITYTLSDIPYWTVIPAVTSPGADRESMSVIARTFAGIGAGVVTAFTMTAVAKFGGGNDVASYRIGFGRLALLVAVIYVVFTVITVLYLPESRKKTGESGTGKEDKHASEENSASIKSLFSALLKNDQAIILSVIIVLFYSATTLTLNTAIYLFDYDIASPGDYTMFMVMGGAAQFAAMVILYPLLRKKFSNRQIFMGGCLCGLIGYVFLIVQVPLEAISIASIAVPCIMVSASNGFAYVLVTVFVANAVDYGEAKTGKRENGMVSSLQTLMVKISSALAIFIAGIGLDAVGFVDNAPGQAHEALVKMRFLFCAPSFVMMGIAGFLFFRRKDIGK